MAHFCGTGCVHGADGDSGRCGGIGARTAAWRWHPSSRVAVSQFSSLFSGMGPNDKVSYFLCRWRGGDAGAGFNPSDRAIATMVSGRS